MVNILSYIKDGQEVLINQLELKTEEGRKWLKEQLTKTDEETKTKPIKEET